MLKILFAGVFPLSFFPFLPPPRSIQQFKAANHNLSFSIQYSSMVFYAPCFVSCLTCIAKAKCSKWVYVCVYDDTMYRFRVLQHTVRTYTLHSTVYSFICLRILVLSAFALVVVVVIVVCRKCGIHYIDVKTMRRNIIFS